MAPCSRLVDFSTFINHPDYLDNFINLQEASTKIATEVLGYCKNKEIPDKWSLATEGEVYLYLGETSLGLEKYKQAIQKEHGANLREIISMYDQAFLILEELKDDKGRKQLDKIFYRN